MEGQSIDGATTVCPLDYRFYAINDDRCASKESVSWSITNGEIISALADVAYVHWNETDASSGNLSVTYICVPSLDPSESFEVDYVSLNVNYRNIQTPFFDSPILELPIEDNSWFMIATPDQGSGFTYSWSFPDCLPGIDGNNVTIVTPDLFATGEICLTVYNELCDLSITECIEIVRTCEDSKTYFEGDDLPVFTSVETNINTVGNVVTALPDVEFKAGESIDLNPGFVANAEFLAHIGECGRAPGSGDCIGQGTFDWPPGGNLLDHKDVPIAQSAESRTVKNKLSRDDNNTQMKVFPNPASDNFTIALHDFDKGEKYTFEILGLNGQLLQKGQLFGKKTTIDIDDLSKGIYLIRVSNSIDMSITRLVKF